MRREYISYPQDIPVLISCVNVTEYPIHWHNSIEILYVLKGNFYITIDSDKYELVERDIEIVNIDEAHSVFAREKDNLLLIFHIDPNFFEKYYSDIQNMFFYTNMTDDNGQVGEEYDELRILLSMIICEAVQKQDNYDEEIEDILVKILYHLINNFHYLTNSMEDIGENEEILERYHRIIKYIFNNYNDNITLQKIAEKEFLSTHYLSHGIKDTTGYSFTDLLNLTRADEAIKLLLDTDKTISEISEEVGFSHTRYFNKHFKIHFKSSPSQFRKKYKVDQDTFEDQKKIRFIELSKAFEFISYYLEDYDRFNYEDKITKIYLNMENTIGEFYKGFKKIINVGDAFDLLIEDNKDILRNIQVEIGFKCARVLNVFSHDMGVFKESKFYNWNRVCDVFEFLDSIGLNILIVIDQEFTANEFKIVLNSFLSYFNEIEGIDFDSFKFQFSSRVDDEYESEISEFLLDYYKFDFIKDKFVLEDNINFIYDTAYMLPFTIDSTINKNRNMDVLRAFDVLDNQVNLTNEVFFGYPGFINDKKIKKPLYYAYFLMNKLGDTLVDKNDNYIVTKSNKEYQILLFSYHEDIDNFNLPENFSKFRGSKNITEKKFSLNIVGVHSDVRVITYEINEKVGSSYNYWIDMGKPKRLSKEEKEILHKASFPRIHFRSIKKSTVLNIRTRIQGYGAVLIVIKEV
ncbi:helix-turn-helix domain-containing protein [Clostridium fermenticellae]|uniref:Helix-turn-helix domain-containing protein n=1 Tax=Clostridium fermenticellae TaxID=2068654 RepID=A0A386H617_9CLOT|nr:helix-turn-helix domain-containing protein [Clostridium fermenticellae]AYD41159.1 helix-turn-helix domain-containing protein [Clostridium fermenticellae]